MKLIKRINRFRSKRHFWMIDSRHLRTVPCSLTFDDDLLYITTFNSEIKVPLKDIKEIRPGQRTDEWFEFRYRLQQRCNTNIHNITMMFRLKENESSKSFSILVPRQDHPILGHSYNFFTEKTYLYETLIAVDLKNRIDACKQQFRMQSYKEMMEVFYNEHIDDVVDTDEDEDCNLVNSIKEPLIIERLYRFLKHINLNLDRQYLNSIMLQNLSKGKIIELMKRFDSRPVFNFLFFKYSICKSRLMSREGLRRFFLEEQQETLAKEQLDQLMNEYSDILEDHDPHEPGKEQYLTKNAFYRLMESDLFDLFNVEHRQVCQDMTHPLSDYFIESSHNSYLSGNQLSSASSYEMYRQILLTGCRCVEIDVWDETTDSGESHPIVHHGHTLTTKIQLEGVLQTIMEVAFVHSDYPVIISVENRCKNINNHRKMAHLMRRIFKERLYVEPVKGDRFPSPEELRGRIFIKCSKKEPLHRSLSEESDIGVGEYFDKKISFGCWELSYISKDLRRQHIESLKRVRRQKTERQESVIVINNDIEENDLKYLQRPILRFRRLSYISENRIQQLQKRTFDRFRENRQRKKAELQNGIDDQIMQDQLANDQNAMICHDGEFSIESKENDSDNEQISLNSSQDIQNHLINEEVNGQEAKSNDSNEWDESFSSLINYFQTRKFHSIEECVKDFQFYQMISRDEKKSRELIENHLDLYREFTRTNMVRVYPAGWRQDSSNYCPMDHWNAGCQLVALNYQRYYMPMFINKALFSLNGECGYVLKPRFLRRQSELENAPPLPSHLKIHILCGQFWNHFDWKKLGLKIIIRIYSGSRKFSQSTQIIKNGFNPVWNEAFEFKLEQPELTFVHFTLTNCDNFFGQYLISFLAIRKGFRHILLYDSKYRPVEYARLYLHVDYY